MEPPSNHELMVLCHDKGLAGVWQAGRDSASWDALEAGKAAGEAVKRAHDALEVALDVGARRLQMLRGLIARIDRDGGQRQAGETLEESLARVDSFLAHTLGVYDATRWYCGACEGPRSAVNGCYCVDCGGPLHDVGRAGREPLPHINLEGFPEQVHILHAGIALCGRRQPWPPWHRWVRVDESDDLVTCEGCKRAAERMGKRWASAKRSR